MGSFDMAILKSWRAGAATFGRGFRGGPISLPDKFGPTAKYDHLLRYHGLNADGIAKKIIKLFKK